MIWDFFPDFFPIEGVPLVIVHLLRTDDRDGVATDEQVPEFSCGLSIFEFFCLVKNNVDVDVECFQEPHILPLVFEFYKYPFVAGLVQCI